MKKKTFPLSMLALLLLLTVLNMNIHHASAPPQSPYIMIVPPTQTIADDSPFTVTITTDYYNSSYDLWGYQIQLTYDTSHLQCIQVSNGNLITVSEDPSARFNFTINSAIGEVSVGAIFYYVTPPPYTTSGPGTLASVTFRAIRAGTSALILNKATKLQGFNLPNKVFNIIAADEKPYNIGHGAITATVGDANDDSKVNVLDIYELGKAYGSVAGPPPSPNWNPDCDFHKDDIINNPDLTFVSTNYGESW